MTARPIAALFLPLLLACLVGADDQPNQPSPAPPISKETRMNLIRSLNAELAYARSPFPMGKKGLALKNGKLSPAGDDLQQLMALWGPAAKPGDQVRITDVVIKDKLIHFEINGGPVKKQKWYQRITISGIGGEAPVAPSDPNANPRGSFVNLEFDKYVPEMTADQVKDLLRPALDFSAKSAAEAYLETVPPKVKEAIKDHQVLVGMNREMVTYAKGRPPRKVREKDGDKDYEEWIYGEPPKDVDFVRLVGDEVVRVETMRVNGQRQIRTEKEVDLTRQAAGAKEAEAPAVVPGLKPSLRRPGEDKPESDVPKSLPAGGRSPLPPTTVPPPPGGPDSPPHWEPGGNQ
jgi:hypothetical protein